MSFPFQKGAFVFWDRCTSTACGEGSARGIKELMRGSCPVEPQGGWRSNVMSLGLQHGPVGMLRVGADAEQVDM